jgi:hypothetical protein
MFIVYGWTMLLYIGHIHAFIYIYIFFIHIKTSKNRTKILNKNETFNKLLKVVCKIVKFTGIKS